MGKTPIVINVSKDKLKEVGISNFREWIQLDDSVYIGQNYRVIFKN